MNFIIKLIKGEYGLRKTFWIYGTLYQLILGAIIVITINFSLGSIDISSINFNQKAILIIKQILSEIKFGYMVIILFEIFILIIYTIIITIGMWKSASNNDGWFWSFCVKLMIAGSIINFLFGLTSQL